MVILLLGHGTHAQQIERVVGAQNPDGAEYETQVGLALTTDNVV